MKNTKLQPSKRTDPIMIHFRVNDRRDEFVPEIQIIWNTEKDDLEALKTFTRMQMGFIAYQHIAENAKMDKDWNIVAPIIYEFCKAFVGRYESHNNQFKTKGGLSKYIES